MILNNIQPRIQCDACVLLLKLKVNKSELDDHYS